MPVFPLRWPRRGITESFAFSDQPPETSYDEQNVRTRDPRTGRIRGAQRAGYSRYLSSQIAASKVQNLASVQLDNPNVTFANKSTGLDSTDTETTVDTPSSGDCLGAAIDELGNLYALDGKAGMVKYNPNFVEQYRLSFPTANPDDVIRTIEVDAFRSIYAGVSEGTRQEDAAVFCYIPDATSNAILLWTFKPGGFVKRLRVSNGVLYGIFDMPDVQKSELFAITDLDIASPTTILRKRIPYPANDFDIGPNGSVYIAFPEFTGRGLNPQAPDADGIQESWTPRDFADYSEKIWCWHDAHNIDGQNNASLQEDDDVLLWIDQSGNNRHYYAAIDETLAPTASGTAVPVTPPKFRTKAQAGEPGVAFNGSSNLMKSRPNESTSYANRDAQKSCVPAFREAVDYSGAAIDHSGAAFLMFLAVRVDQAEPNVARYLWSHEDADIGASDGDRHIFVNRSDDGDTTPTIDSTDLGRVSVWEETHNTTGNGASNFPASGNNADTGGSNDDYGFDDQTASPTFGNALENESGILILTYLCDGNFQDSSFTDTAGVADQTHSLLRLNGRPIDRWISLPNYSIHADYLGGTGVADAALHVASSGTVNRFFRGQILERLVFHRGDIDLSSATTEPLIVSHEAFGYEATGTGDTDWPGVGTDQDDANLITLVEGYLGHRWGKKSVLPQSTAAQASGSEYPHPFSNLVPLAPSEPASANIQGQILSTPFYSKYAGDSGQHLFTRGGGGGYSIVVDSQGRITTWGLASGAPAIVGDDEDADGLPSNVWSDNAGMTGATAFASTYPRLALDSKDNVYLPVSVVPTVGTQDGDVVVYKRDGTALNDWDRDTDQWLVYAVLPGIVPTYPDSLTNQRAQFFYAFGKDIDENSDDLDNVAKVSIVSQSLNTDAPRTRTDLAVVSGTVYKFTTSSSAAVTGGSSALGSTARFIDSVAFREQVFYTDGNVYKYYDAEDDALADWVSQKGGEIPPRCRLIARWNGRVLLARGDDPTDFFMSKKGDPFDWDFVPPVATVDQAIKITDSRLGAVPDIVTALVPMSEDLLLIGCDHSIHRMTGEPLVSGSAYDLLSSDVGIAWNTSWARDRSGNVYVMDSQGGILQIAGSGQITDLTRDAIDERLRAIDLSTYYAKLIWSERFRGLHVYLLPFGAGGTIVEHYFWEQQTGAWRPDKFGSATVQPTAAMILDGDDPDDRTLLIGTEQGYILMEDPDADDDDTTAIDSYIRMGPLIGSEPDFAARFTGFEITLADNRDGCTLGLFVSDEPDVFGKPRHEIRLEPGRNGRINTKIRGAVAWLQFRNATSGESWAFENGRYRVHRAGRLRPRPRENTVGT